MPFFLKTNPLFILNAFLLSKSCRIHQFISVQNYFLLIQEKKAPCSLPQFSQESISSAFRHHFSPPILQDSKWRNKEQERRPAPLCTLLHITAMWWLHANVQLICAKLPMLEQECVSLMPRRSQDVLSWPPTPNPSKFARNPTKKRNPAKMRNPRKMSKSGRTEMRPSLTASLDLVNLGNILASYFADVCLGSIC